MKTIGLFVLASVVVSYLGLGEFPEGSLTEEKAYEYAHNKCYGEYTVEHLDTEGYLITCSEEFQALPGELTKRVVLSYSHNPDRPFVLYYP